MLYLNTPTSCDGNCQFYEDAGQGSAYGLKLIESSRMTTVSLGWSVFSGIILAASSGSVFGLGIDLLNAGDFVSIGGKNTYFANSRPSLSVTYNITFANETSGEDATRLGIQKAIVQPKILDDQKVILAIPEQVQALLTYY